MRYTLDAHISLVVGWEIFPLFSSERSKEEFFEKLF
jgi:hypothetical protein